MKRVTRADRAFTLVELLVASGVVAVLGGVIVALINASMILYGQNVSTNRTLWDSVSSTEKLLFKVTAAAEVPVLVDAAGATVSGNGPAEGIRFFSPKSSRAYAVPVAVPATAMSFTITKTAAQPAPQAGDKITMADLGFKGLISSVSASGSSYTIWFASSVGSGFTPPTASGTVIPAGSKGFLLAPMAFISVDAAFRHYPRAMSVVQDGASAFNNQANFNRVAALLPVGAQTNAFPFQYPDAGRRLIDVRLRLRSPAHGGRIDDFYTFQNLTTTVAFRSAMTK
ncbi:MAG: prepilin-type N-terminal cleavage/methylation domain-containing protein [Chthoniobacteraceae bacterium]